LCQNKAEKGTKKETCKNINKYAGHLWLTPVILATQEAEIRRIAVQSQPRQIPYLKKKKKPSQKRAGGVAQSPVQR
jgi:hypothetical protein